MNFENILVICVGNICRSPMAEALLKQKYPHKHIDSAGVGALVGHSADSKAMEVMKTHDGDISDHIAKQVSTELVKQADLILTMSDSQTKWLESQWSFCRGKTFKIGHWIDKEIADPYKKDISEFKKAYKDIEDSLEEWFERIS